MGRVRVTSILTSRWLPKKVADLDDAILDMATDIHKAAVLLAPKDTRALANSGQVQHVGAGHIQVIFGGGSVPYARRRHYENLLHPGTLRYLERPGDQIARAGIKKYLRRI